LSHVALSIQNEGDICFCNKNTQSFEDGKKNKLYLHKDGLEKSWASPTRKLVQAGLDNGIKVSGCSSCWADEDAGVMSYRQQYNQKLVGTKSITTQPQVLFIRPTNICNMGCRTCQPATSTGLYQDYYQLEKKINLFAGSFKDYTSQFDSIRLGLGEQNLTVWDTFEKWIPGLEFIDIYGGEPMLASAMWDRMLAVANQNKTNNTKIQFHTNGTIWNKQYIDILPKFKEVNIGISIDSHLPEQLQYIRHGIDLTKLYENLKKYIELSKQYNNISVYICCTVSIYNVWYIDDIFNELKQHGLPVGINVVYGPDHYDMRHLPVPIKNQLVEKFSNSNLPKIVNLLNQTIPGHDVYWPKFCREVKLFDKIRNQNFANIFPDYYQALLPYLVDS
jgi:organic radical activating enzyme